MRDLKNNVGAFESVRPAVQSATVTGETVDALGFGVVMAVVQTGAIVSAGDFTAKIQDSDDGATWADVADTDLIGTLSETLTANTVERVGYVGEGRYVRVVLTKNGGTSVAASAVVVLGRPALAPVP
ncbi:hypothetical protein [Rhodospirillum sp. A1_3_36]|uniref:hypothetical protein n=1 Tax=Rhodospirillum sp. A1_3_36 TaxID=3391666 RepID=UPI0039A755BF